MTYAQARLRIWNHTAYDRSEVREAAIFILAAWDASQEDRDQAAFFV